MVVKVSRSLFTLVAMVLVSGCAPEYPSPLTLEEQQTYVIDQVDIYIADNAWVNWPAGEDKVKEQFGISTEPRIKAGVDARDEPVEERPPEIDIKQTDWGSEALRKLALERFEELVKPTLLGSLSGTKPAHMSVVLTSVALVSPGQSILIGGTNSMYAGFQVFDLETGDPLTNKAARLSLTPASGGLLRTIITEAFDLNFDNTAKRYGNLVKDWIEATEPVMIVDREDLLTFKDDIPGPTGPDEAEPSEEDTAEPTS